MSKQIEAMKLVLRDLERSESKLHKARAALREALAEQPAQQEPVAWGIIASNTGRICQVELDADEVEGHNPKHIVPLYTTPQPPAQPLTDEQCDAIYTALDEWAKEFDPYEFGLPSHCGDGMVGGRAIIRKAAHGITKGST